MIKKHFTTILTFLLLIPIRVYGEESYTLLQPLSAPGAELQTKIQTDNLASYLTFLIQIIIGVVGVLAVIKIILGGLRLMSTDAVSGHSEGRKSIEDAIGGLVLAIAAWLILYTINPDILNIPTIK